MDPDGGGEGAPELLPPQVFTPDTILGKVVGKGGSGEVDVKEDETDQQQSSSLLQNDPLLPISGDLLSSTPPSLPSFLHVSLFPSFRLLSLLSSFPPSLLSFRVSFGGHHGRIRKWFSCHFMVALHNRNGKKLPK